MFSTTKSRILLPFVLIAVCISTVSVFAQSETPAALKIRAKAMIDAGKLTEALPLYERLVQLTPNDGDVHLYLGFALMGQITLTNDPAERKQLRIRARSVCQGERAW